MNIAQLTTVAAEKLKAAGASPPVIVAFTDCLARFAAGESGLLPEASVGQVGELPALDTLPARAAFPPSQLERLVVIKLNGGLGTGMGLEQAKSLIPVRGTDTFLDFIAEQIGYLRRLHGGPRPAFYLMNSFSTQRDTLDYLKKHHPDLLAAGPVDFLQSKVPKLDATTFTPVSWPKAPDLEWCPPGHGDIYPSMVGAGLLDELLAQGVRYAFVSNSDNLGATVDPRVVDYFAESGLSFLMEVAERTAADRKGGHLARRQADGRLILRESVQCPLEDAETFQDITRHRYFNTNNLWLRLDHLREELQKHGGLLPLPLIANHKTVDPKDGSSPKVVQLETAMGAAIECFQRAGALLVPRSRFAPVKATSDLLAVRSDAYEVTNDHRLLLVPHRRGLPPVIDLDNKHFKTIADFESAFPKGPPSLAHCDSLKITGPVRFEAGVVCRGRVSLTNPSTEPRVVSAGTYENVEKVLA
jgi:UDP-N-acetylglucosamine pyrophosphorylase